MLPGVRIGSLSQVDRSRTGTVAAWFIDGQQRGGKQRLKRRVASAAFYNEKLNVNSVFIQRYLVDTRESGELRQSIDAIVVAEMGNSTMPPLRRPRAGGDPSPACAASAPANWIPACAGMTSG
jgi:hypothetical protein